MKKLSTQFEKFKFVSLFIIFTLLGACTPPDDDQGGETTDPETHAYFNVSNIVPSSLAVDFDLTSDNEDIDGVVCRLYEKESYNQDTFIEDAEHGEIVMAITESGSYRFADYLTPDTEYLFAFAPVTNNGNFSSLKYSIVEDGIETIEIKTTLTFGEKPLTAPLKIIDNGPAIDQITVEITNPDMALESYYFGYVPTTTLAEYDSLEEYIIESEWLSINWAESFKVFDFVSGEYINHESVEETITRLSPGVKYTVFTIAVSLNYELGEITEKSFETVAIDINEDIEIEATITPATTTAAVELSFSNCEKVYYMVTTDKFFLDDTSNANAFGQLYSDTLNPDCEAHWDAAGTYNIVSLIFSTDYVLYLLGVDDTGSVSNIEAVEFTTNPLTMDSAAAIDPTFNKLTISDGGPGDLNYSVTFDMNMNSDCEGYYCVLMNKEEVINTYDKLTAEAAMQVAYDKGDLSAYEITEAQHTVNLLVSKQGAYDDREGLAILFVPYDDKGNYGKSALIEYDNNWKE